jgi:hypothetical protein
MTTKAVTISTTGLPTAEKVGRLQVALAEFQETANNLIAQADRAVITDAQSYANGGDLIKIARTQGSKAEDLRKEITSPFYNLYTLINKAFKPVAGEFEKVRTTVERKMVTWKRAEDARLREEAAKEARRLEEEALAQAAAEVTEEDQNEILEEATKVTEKLIEKAKVGVTRGNYGSSTSGVKKYSTEVKNLRQFLAALPAVLDNLDTLELGQVVDLKKSGLNVLAKLMLEKGIKEIHGAEFIESEALRIF